MYTMNELTKINQEFILHHYNLMESDLNKANNFVKLIEETRSTLEPKAGDILRYTDEHGTYYGHTHIEKISVEDGKIYASVCEHPYIPFISKANNGIYCNTSGGAWHSLDITNFIYKGTEKKTFQDWGHCGACASGTVKFDASVSVWEYIAENNPYFNEGTKEHYTTKDFNKHYISYRSEPSEMGYKFFADGIAWKNELDFQAWLHTFNGVVFRGNWENQIVVWTWKENQKHVSPKEFETINGIEDALLCNGIQRCKRVYDEENHIVNTYFVWYWDDEETENLSFSEKAMKQNEIREKYYTLDWRTHRENEHARRGIEAGTIKTVDLSKFLEL